MNLQRLSAASLPPLPAVAGGWSEKTYEVVGERFDLTLPAVPDALLDTEETLAAHQADGYMPYWGYLWPTSLDTCKAILQRKFTPNLKTLELGTGVGLVGVAAMRAGLDVLVTDYDPLSVHLALHNAARNGYPNAQGIVLDWRNPPSEQYPLILACDLIYELQNHEPLLKTLDAMLTPDGEAWFTDPGRHHAGAFVDLIPKRGYSIRHQAIERELFPSRPAGTTDLWIVSRK